MSERRLTFEERVKKLKEKNPDIVLISIEKTEKYKVVCTYKCICGNIRTAYWDSLLRGCKCQECANNKEMTFEQRVERLKRNNPNVILLKTFKKNNRTKCVFKTNFDETERTSDWSYLNDNILNPVKTYEERLEFYKGQIIDGGFGLDVYSFFTKNGKGSIFLNYKCKCGNILEKRYCKIIKGEKCINCLNRKYPTQITIEGSENRIITEKLTFEEKVKMMKILRPEIELINEFKKDGKWHVTYKCSCGEITSSIFGNLKSLKGCKNCKDELSANSRRYDFEKKKEIMLSVNPNIQLIDEFKTESNRWACTYICECGDINKKTFDKLKAGQKCKKCGTEKAHVDFRLTLEEIKERLKENNPNILVLSKDYNPKEKIECMCKKCGYIWKTMYNGCLGSGSDCPECARKNKRNEKSCLWKGGLTPLHVFLRTAINEWKYESFKKAKYTCEISGLKNKRKITIHHTHNFSDILKETLKILNLEIHQDLTNYSVEDIENLRKTCLELHYKYGLGVCLSFDEHKLFHKEYGRINNTLEQYNEFKEMRLKELNKILEN